jgi:hypothetical protein
MFPPPLSNKEVISLKDQVSFMMNQTERLLLSQKRYIKKRVESRKKKATHELDEENIKKRPTLQK